MAKKWYSFFVSFEPASPEATESEAAPTPAQTVADIAALLDPGQPAAASPGTSATFDQIYEAAGVRTPGHGYDILKVAAMLESEHIRSQAREVKRRSVMLALDAAGAALPDIIKDAIRRDRALDACEAAKQKQLSDFGLAKANENGQLRGEIERLEARIKANAAEMLRERERFFLWQQKKRQEEQKIAEAVSYFVTENPITTCPAQPDGEAARSVAPAPWEAPSPNPAENAG